MRASQERDRRLVAAVRSGARGLLVDPLYDRYQVRTDLAVEAHRLVVEREGPPEIPGVLVQNEETPVGTITRVRIEGDVGARLMGKVKGNYSTLSVPGLRERDQTVHEQIAQTLAKEMVRFLEGLGLGPRAAVLVAGLGNWQATPDALGPKVVDKVLVTRHLWNLLPPEKRGGLRAVSAVAPGVLGLTGMETEEIIRGVVATTRPACVICVDALAARSAERLASTIQLADVGVNPGSGVGNTRRGITRESLGVPVIAVGVPTVVHAATLISDGLDLMRQRGLLDGAAAGGGAPLGGPLQPAPPGVPLLRPGHPEAPTAAEQQAEQRKRAVVREVLSPYMQEMIVTPKEIDVLIDDIAEVLAGALNTALHPDLDLNEVVKYI